MDFISEIKAIFDVKKLPTKFFLLFSLVSGFVLFASESLLSKLKLNKISDEYGTYLGLIFLLSTGLVIINFSIWIYNYFNLKYRFQKSKKELKETLKRLDPHEKSVIREFFLQQQSSIPMPYDDPVISGLLDKNIIKFNKQFGDSMITSMGKAPVSLGKYTEKLLRLEYIDLKENPTEEELQIIQNNRPKWISRRY